MRSPSSRRALDEPGSGATYPSGWSISIPAKRLTIGLTPTVVDQELDTRATTGVVYWEGSQQVTARRDGKSLAGQAYVELTGYAPAGAAGSVGSALIDQFAVERRGGSSTLTDAARDRAALSRSEMPSRSASIRRPASR